ncbi:uncharacterized protein LOC125959456 isoform X2 [Anopheles darlingi]|uniref:uncharacterized protein LOC125959456 isoform X2 n=1 Tax=Anopheles darlingi TaxID=43151 RepID=UPI0020FFF909|nr:uncharacterized protein LOC125959456 isoform X2 [Anopheles darlingi]
MATTDTRAAVSRKIPVPNNYRCAAKMLRQVTEEKKSIKTLLRDEKHFRAGRTIMDRLLVNLPQINAIIAHIDLTTKEPRLNPWLARALISELLYGRGELLGASLPVECVRRHETEIRKAYEATKASIPVVQRFEEPRFVRVNTELLNLEGAKRLMQEEGWILVDEEFPDYQSFLNRVQSLTDSEYMVDFHFNDLLVFPHCSKGYWARAEHLLSKFFLQNKACLVPTYLLKPPKKSVVLDMCSAPGMKATHLASLMKNKGRLYAVERNAERYKLLCQYAAPFGVIKTIQADCLDLTDEQVPGVEYILLDPSCSGSGMLDRLRMPEPVDEGRLYKLAGLQYKLLSHAMNSFPNARRIVYSTCSIHPEENEKVVMGVLRHNSHFRLLDARTELGKEWLNLGSPDYPGVGERCLYARSETDLTIGMFVAVFERCADGEENEIYMAHEQQKESYAKLAAIGSEGRKGKKNRGENNFKPVENEPEVQQRHSSGLVAERQHTSAAEGVSAANGVIGEQSESVSKKKSKRKTDSEHTDSAIDETTANGMIAEASESISKKKSKRKADSEHTDSAIDETTANGMIGEQSESVSKKKSKRKADSDHTDSVIDDTTANGVIAQPSESVSKKNSKRKTDSEHTDSAIDETTANGMIAEQSESVSKKKSKRKADSEHTYSAIDESTANGMIGEQSESVSKKKSKRKSDSEHTDSVIAETTANRKIAEPSESISKKKSKRKADSDHTDSVIDDTTANGMIGEQSESVSKKKSKRKTDSDHTDSVIDESTANGVIAEPSESICKKKSKRKAIPLLHDADKTIEFDAAPIATDEQDADVKIGKSRKKKDRKKQNELLLTVNRPE